MKYWNNSKVYDNPVMERPYDVQHDLVFYEGVRAYKQDNGSIKLWKISDHLDRLLDAAKILNVVIPYSKGDLISACDSLVQACGNTDLYLLLVVYPLKQGGAFVYIYSYPGYPIKSPIKMWISSIVRGYPQFQGQIKQFCNIKSILQSAAPEGTSDFFIKDNQGYLIESTTSNFFVVKGDVIFTPPNNGSILAGITRRCVAEILQNGPMMFAKYKKAPLILEKNITQADVYTANEIFLTDTYSEIIPVISVDGRKIGDGAVGFYTKLLDFEYSLAVRGKKDEAV